MKHFYLKEVSRTRRKFALISLILPMFGKEKSPNFNEVQGFTSFYLLRKWCHQKSNYSPK